MNAQCTSKIKVVIHRLLGPQIPLKMLEENVQGFLPPRRSTNTLTINTVSVVLKEILSAIVSSFKQKKLGSNPDSAIRPY